MNAVQIDIQQLRIKHILFKSKLRSILYGGNLDEIFFSENGPVGQWFMSVGLPKYKMLEQMQELLQIHRDLNKLAKQLVELYKGSKIDQAHDGLRAVDKFSEKFLLILAELEKRPEAEQHV